MLTIQGIPKNPQPLQSNHCARSRMVPPDARRLSPNPLVERSKQLQAKRYVATTISICVCVCANICISICNSRPYVEYGKNSGQRSKPCTMFQRFTSIIALKGKSRVHDPVRIHRLHRNGNQKPLIDWLSNTSQKKMALLVSLNTKMILNSYALNSQFP